MSSRFATGLVVGKFCPLHRGHQHLIDSARSRCEHLVLISYSNPEYPGCEPALREAWLAALYPDTTRIVLDDDRLKALCAAKRLPLIELPANDAEDGVQQEFVAWLLNHLIERPIDAVFTSEAYGDAFAATLSRCVPAPGPVVHVPCDPARHQVPVSGSAVRKDPHALRQFLDPRVYAAFVQRIAVLGGESSGKSTLAALLAQALDTVHVPEFGRELWDARGGQLQREDMLLIAQTQVAREDALSLQAKRWLVCDSTPLTTHFYSCHDFGDSEPALRELATRRYAQVFVCAPDFGFVQDGTRRDDAFRHRQHDWYVAELARRGIPWTLLEGDVAQRLEHAIARLGVA